MRSHHPDVLLEPAALWYEAVLAFRLLGSRAASPEGCPVIGSGLQLKESLEGPHLSNTYQAEGRLTHPFDMLTNLLFCSLIWEVASTAAEHGLPILRLRIHFSKSLWRA